jgi:type II secretory pathway pseudopilin PulG
MDTKMIKQPLSNERGMTLAGIMVTVAVLSILGTFISFSMYQMSRLSLQAQSKRDQEATWFITQKQLSSAVINMDALLFRASRTYGPAAAPTVQHTVINQHRQVFTNADGITTVNMIPDINSRSTITVLPADKINAEGPSFLDPMVSSVVTAQGVPVYQDSFTLRRADVQLGQNAAMRTNIRNIYAARCLPISTSPLHSSGATIDSSAVHKSAAYAFTYLDRAPFINSQRLASGTRTWVSCCPINTPCTTDNLHQHFLRIYNATFRNGNLIHIEETPNVGESSTVWGIGFMLKFNDRARPTRFDMILYTLRDICKTIQVEGCQNLSPAMVSKTISSTSPDHYRDYFRRHFPVRPVVYSGSITPDLSNSGVLRLTQ